MENVTRNMFFDCALILGIHVTLFIMPFLMSPYTRGFFCDDVSIRYPFKPDTISSSVLHTVGFGLSLFTMLILEWVHLWRRPLKDTTSERSVYLLRWTVPAYCLRIYQTIGLFLFGEACQQLIVEVAKYSIGRLRPHFIEVCDPDVDCSNPLYQFKYIEKYNCLKSNKSLIREARMSFPSSHASFSAYCMVYLAIYLQYKITWAGSHLVNHLPQFGCIILSWTTALSRVSDYKHHLTDVLTGLIIGTTTALINARFVSGICTPHPKDEQQPEKTENFRGLDFEERVRLLLADDSELSDYESSNAEKQGETHLQETIHFSNVRGDQQF